MFEKQGYTHIGTKSAETNFSILEGEWKDFQLKVSTYKNDKNMLITAARVGKLEKLEGDLVSFRYIPFEYPFKWVLQEDCPRLSQKRVQEQHMRALDIIQSKGFTL